MEFEREGVFEYLGGVYKPFWIDNNSCNPGYFIDSIVEDLVEKGEISLNSKFRLKVKFELIEID